MFTMSQVEQKIKPEKKNTLTRLMVDTWRSKNLTFYSSVQKIRFYSE